MATRPKPQPALQGPLQKTDRPLLVGAEPAQEAAATGNRSASRDADVPSPTTAAEPTTRSRGRQRSTSAKDAEADVASPGDPLLATVLAGRTPSRSVPITRLEPELHSTLRIISARSGVTIQDMVNSAVRRWLADNQQPLIDAGVLEP